jgi:hypothetical protein
MTRIALIALTAVLGLAACGSEADPTAAPAESDPAALPGIARIVCQTDGPPLVETPAVKPQPDGVHLEIVNETGADLSFALPTMGFGAAPGTSTEVVDLGPGELTVSCSDPNTIGDAEPPGAVLKVVDEDGIWVSTELGCPEQVSSVADYAPGARGETSDPLAAARSALEGYGLEEGDELVRAGYPEAEVARVVLLRQGESLAVVDLIDDGAGKWLVSTVTACSTLAD